VIVAAGRASNAPPPAPSCDVVSPASASIVSKRRISAGFVFTLPAIISDESGTPSCNDNNASTWTAKANRLLVFKTHLPGDDNM
jgi:hypothetical protein